MTSLDGKIQFSMERLHLPKPRNSKPSISIKLLSTTKHLNFCDLSNNYFSYYCSGQFAKNDFLPNVIGPKSYFIHFWIISFPDDDELISNTHRRSLKVHPHMATSASATQKVTGKLFLVVRTRNS